MVIEKMLTQFGDRYDRNARLAPALLVLLPAVVAIIALYGKSLGILGTVVTTIGVCGGLAMLADFARSRGKAGEQALWKKWGGAPSTQVLRYTDDTFDDVSTARYHSLLQAKVGKPFPISRDAEANDPAGTDVLYTSAGNWLREHTRDDKKFAILKTDNIAYGFRRNGYALRWIGVAVALLCIAWVLCRHGVASLTHRFQDVGDIEKLFTGGEWVSLAVALIMLLAWLGFFTEGVVRAAAFSYAQKLIVACEVLSAPGAAKKASPATGSEGKAPRSSNPGAQTPSATEPVAAPKRRGRPKKDDPPTQN